MKIQNKSPKGKWIHVKINGYSYKKWLAGYDSIILNEVTRRDQLNLNAHEESMIHAEEHSGVNIDPSDPFSFLVKVASILTGGTTSLSGASVTVADGMNLSFNVYPQTGYYLSAYTINGVAQTRTSTSATTAYTLSSIRQDENIFVAFARFGA